MKREYRLSEEMNPQKVSEIYAILKARFESTRKKKREEDEKLRFATEGDRKKCQQKKI